MLATLIQNSPCAVIAPSPSAATPPPRAVTFPPSRVFCSRAENTWQGYAGKEGTQQETKRSLQSGHRVSGGRRAVWGTACPSIPRVGARGVMELRWGGTGWESLLIQNKAVSTSPLCDLEPHNLIFQKNNNKLQPLSLLPSYLRPISVAGETRVTTFLL